MAIRNFASESFGVGGGSELAPRQKFQVQLLLFLRNETAIAFNRIASVTAASYSVDGQLMNQYNKKRFVQTRLNYDPITVNFYDTYDNQWHQVWERYTEFYFNDNLGIGTRGSFEGTDTTDPNFETELGFTPNPSRYFFESIQISQAGSVEGTTRITTLNKPHIVSMQGDTLDYSDSNPAMFTVTFQPENTQVEYVPGSDGAIGFGFNSGTSNFTV